MYLTKQEVADLFKVDVKTIERWMKNKDLPFLKLDRTVRFDKQEVEEWAKKQK